MDLHLDGKVVLITGGTDGLGAALADRLVEEGSRVAVCGRDPHRLAATERLLRDAGGDAIAVQADVTRLADLERFVDAAVARWGRIDGLVNNAGRSAAGRIDQVSDDDWVADLDLKVLAAVRCTRLAMPHLTAAGGGAIVNVLSVGAKAAGAASLPTTASRAAGLAITKASSKDLGGHGIRVNAVLVGQVASGQSRRRAAATGQSEDELHRQMARNTTIPLGRVGWPGEFADLAAYLLSDRSSYVTGSAINLDGGTSPVLLSSVQPPDEEGEDERAGADRRDWRHRWGGPPLPRRDGHRIDRPPRRSGPPGGRSRPRAGTTARRRVPSRGALRRARSAPQRRRTGGTSVGR